MQEAKETPLNSPSPSPALTPLSNARLNWYVEEYARDESISGRELYRAFVELRQLRAYKLPCSVRVAGDDWPKGNIGTIITKGCTLETLMVSMRKRAEYDAERALPSPPSSDR